MVKITKVYTKNGDQGTTQLAYGRSINKNTTRIELMGTLDELNSHLGFALVIINNIDGLMKLYRQGIRIQHEIFNLGAQIAVLPADKQPTTPQVTEMNTKRLEDEIDTMNEQLSHLNSFILPGGGEASSRFHLARAICRRAERTMVALALEDEQINTSCVLAFVNRLSDWLFVAARYVALEIGEEEVLWQPG